MGARVLTGLDLGPRDDWGSFGHGLSPRGDVFRPPSLHWVSGPCLGERGFLPDFPKRYILAEGSIGGVCTRVSKNVTFGPNLLPGFWTPKIST